ncbi:MAG: hypothetical protein ACOVN2_09825, partial [Usitatibacteraceae bacterium]
QIRRLNFCWPYLIAGSIELPEFESHLSTVVSRQNAVKTPANKALFGHRKNVNETIKPLQI